MGYTKRQLCRTLNKCASDKAWTYSWSCYTGSASFYTSLSLLCITIPSGCGRCTISGSWGCLQGLHIQGLWTSGELPRLLISSTCKGGPLSFFHEYGSGCPLQSLVTNHPNHLASIIPPRRVFASFSEILATITGVQVVLYQCNSSDWY